jgi:hypothetical protein
MTRFAKCLAFAGALTFSLSFSQVANAVSLFFGTKSIDLTNSPNDCLTMGIGTLNRPSFANLKRSDVDVSGTRQNSIVSITCVASPASPRFVVVVMVSSDDQWTATSLLDLVLSNF